ncbi:hypothetical protein LINPERPRIM_LOCUS31434 [Linum perenne]
MDCYSGYNQIYIANDDIHKTAFRCPGAIGCYEWVVMPFGLKNDGRLINELLTPSFMTRLVNLWKYT